MTVLVNPIKGKQARDMNGGYDHLYAKSNDMVREEAQRMEARERRWWQDGHTPRQVLIHHHPQQKKCKGKHEIVFIQELHCEPLDNTERQAWYQNLEQRYGPRKVET